MWSLTVMYVESKIGPLSGILFNDCKAVTVPTLLCQNIMLRL